MKLPFLFFVAVGLVFPAMTRELPNILIIYADDLGYGDLSTYNPKAAYTTPRLDQMAAEGIKFLDAHSPSTICSPSRYGLFSGQQVCRTGRGSRAFEGPGGPSYLAPGEMTVAEMLQKQGYRTGVFGKWHLGLTWYDKSGKQLGGGFENSLLIDYEKSTPLAATRPSARSSCWSAAGSSRATVSRHRARAGASRARSSSPAASRAAFPDPGERRGVPSDEPDPMKSFAAST